MNGGRILIETLEPRILTGDVGLFLLRGLHAGALGSLLPRLRLMVQAVTFLLELVVGGAELRDGLFGQELFQRPLLDVLLLVLLELGDELDGTLKDGTLVLLTAGHDLG